MSYRSIVYVCIPLITLVGTFLLFQGCGSSTNSSSTTCSLTQNTTEGTKSTNGCALLTRDTSSCLTSRQAQGLSGFWLKFSCRVTLTKSGSNVLISADGQPDHKSPYFSSTDACFESGFPSGRSANPNTLGVQSLVMTVPYSPSTPSGTTGTAMLMGTVGIAINGVSIFSNAAAPGDSIYNEVSTFDSCEGHPASTKYHYHTEPTTATNSDSNFIGVMNDGFPIYGRKDSNLSTPTLNLASGGAHLGTTVDSPSTPVYHYHVNLQTSGSNSAYFITSGFQLNSAGTCTGCR